MTGRSPVGSGLRPFGVEPQDASQAEPLVPNAALVSVLEAARDFLAGNCFNSGVCCCGELIANHDPYHTNHSPRDELAYQASLLCERIAASLPLVRPEDCRGFTPWEHDPDEFDRQAEEDARQRDPQGDANA